MVKTSGLMGARTFSPFQEIATDRPTNQTAEQQQDRRGHHIQSYTLKNVEIFLFYTLQMCEKQIQKPIYSVNKSGFFVCLELVLVKDKLNIYRA